MTRNEVDAVLNAPPSNTDWGLRDRALLRLLYSAGLLCAELSHVRICDLDFILNEVRIDKEAGRADLNEASGSSCVRYIPFDEETAQALRLYIRKTEGQFQSRQDLLFPGRAHKPMTRQAIWKIVRKYGMIAGVAEAVTPKMFRNVRQTELAEKNKK